MANVSSSNGIEKCPKLRFPEFTKPWGSVQLGALFKKNTQKNSAGVVTNVICNSAKNGLIPQKDYFDKDIANADNTAGYYIISKNDFVYNPRKSADAPYGPISRYTYEEDGIVSPLYLCFCGSKEVNPEYFERYFRSSAWHRYIYMSGDSGARHDRVSIKDDTFFEMPIYLPCNHEQKKIADFLSLLEKKIEYQTALIDNLKKYKRGATNNIFNGYTFNESVKECLLSDVASFHQGLTYSPGDVSDMGYLVMRSSNIQNGRLSFRDNVYVKSRISESLLVQENDVLMCVRNGSKQLVGKTAIIDQAYPNMTWGAFMMIIRSTLKNTFVYHYLNSDSFYNQVFRDSGTATINQITKGTLNECKLFIPNSEQQERICQYLDLLDRKLHKEEDYLENLRLLKQSLLQKLFI